MISFASPLILLLAPVVVGLLALLLVNAERRRRDALARLGNPTLIARLMSGVNPRVRWAQALLALGALAAGLLALARPQWGEEVRTVQREGLQVVIALDVSTSMLADDLAPNRLARAKLEIAELLQRLDGDEVALVLFSGAAFVQFPLTSDYNTAQQFLQAAAPGVISQPGTNVGEAIRTAMDAFDANAQAQRVLVLMTDGEAHDSDARTAAQQAAEAGVRIFTVGLGSPAGAPVPQLDLFGNVVGQRIGEDGLPILTYLDEATLQEIAEIGGGTYALVSPSGAHLDQLQAALAALQEGAMGEQTDVIRIERFQLFLALALALLLIATLLPARTGRRTAAPVEAAPMAPQPTPVARPPAAAQAGVSRAPYMPPAAGAGEPPRAFG